LQRVVGCIEAGVAEGKVMEVRANIEGLGFPRCRVNPASLCERVFGAEIDGAER
jgi:hypothetical protein